MEFKQGGGLVIEIGAEVGIGIGWKIGNIRLTNFFGHYIVKGMVCGKITHIFYPSYELLGS